MGGIFSAVTFLLIAGLLLGGPASAVGMRAGFGVFVLPSSFVLGSLLGFATAAFAQEVTATISSHGDRQDKDD